jgi:hypothetical protein
MAGPSPAHPSGHPQDKTSHGYVMGNVIGKWRAGEGVSPCPLGTCGSGISEKTYIPYCTHTPVLDINIEMHAHTCIGIGRGVLRNSTKHE